ncbi:MAG: ABC transporter ATP-binding protein [Candidatus Obscuribacterales bacterium]|nr:ABC transporter ATP-binding protein [Candidatus Obscuribacterales bacterium]
MKNSDSIGTLHDMSQSGTGSKLAPAIQAVSLTKQFGDRVVVDRLSFSVKEGDIYALLGDNGAGKTTTINMLTTLLSPTSGDVFISGFHSIKQAEKCKKAFGVVSQDVCLYQELTAYENLIFIADLYGMNRAQAIPRIKQLLAQAGLADRANDLAGEFSGGMMRKLSIAMAILHNPKVLFMDEPTVGLDPASRRQIWVMLKELRSAGVTILLTTHYLEEAELLADRIGIIRRGQMVLEGNIEELRAKTEGIHSISIRLAKTYSQEELNIKIERLLLRLPTQINYDPVRNTISIAQPKDAQLVPSMQTVLNWLETEKLVFSNVATNEPSLEEIFLAVSTGTAVTR